MRTAAAAGRSRGVGLAIVAAGMLVLAPAMAKRGKKLAKGQTVITGSLIGMNWLTGKHQLKGVIDGCGEVAIGLAA